MEDEIQDDIGLVKRVRIEECRFKDSCPKFDDKKYDHSNEYTPCPYFKRFLIYGLGFGRRIPRDGK